MVLARPRSCRTHTKLCSSPGELVMEALRMPQKEPPKSCSLLFKAYFHKGSCCVASSFHQAGGATQVPMLPSGGAKAFKKGLMESSPFGWYPGRLPKNWLEPLFKKGVPASWFPSFPRLLGGEPCLILICSSFRVELAGLLKPTFAAMRLLFAFIGCASFLRPQ